MLAIDNMHSFEILEGFKSRSGPLSYCRIMHFMMLMKVAFETLPNGSEVPVENPPRPCR